MKTDANSASASHQGVNPNHPHVLVDTCVLLDDPSVLSRIRTRGGLPFISSTILDELDFNKSGSNQININAKIIFRELNRKNPRVLKTMPNLEPLLGSDLLTEFSYQNTPVYLLGRNAFKSSSNNDAKIIEIALDYRMILITRDNAMKVRAETLGVKVARWTGPTGQIKEKRNLKDGEGHHTPPQFMSFSSTV